VQLHAPALPLLLLPVAAARSDVAASVFVRGGNIHVMEVTGSNTRLRNIVGSTISTVAGGCSSGCSNADGAAATAVTFTANPSVAYVSHQGLNKISTCNWQRLC